MTNKQLNITLLAVITLNVVAVLIGIHLYLRDDAPIDDSDLVFEYVPIPEDQNAFKHWDRASDQLSLTDDEFKTSAKFCCRLEAWDPVEAKKLVDKAKAEVDEFLRIADYQRLQVPEVPTYDTVIDYAHGREELVWLITTRARLLAQEGRYEEALSLYLKCIQIGHMIKHGDGPTVVYMIGGLMQHIAIWQLLTDLPTMHLSSGALRKAVKRLEKYERDSGAIIRSIELELEILTAEIDRITGGRDQAAYLTEEHLGFLRSRLPGAFLPNQTRNYFVNYLGEMSKSLAREDYLWREDFWARKEDRIGPRNFLGRAIAADVLSTTQKIPKYTGGYLTDVRACRVILGILAFRAEKGRLPNGLNELVPQFIHKLPVCALSNKPFKINAEQRTLWSHGNSRSQRYRSSRRTRKEIQQDFQRIKPWVRYTMFDHPTWPIPDPPQMKRNQKQGNK